MNKTQDIISITTSIESTYIIDKNKFFICSSSICFNGQFGITLG